MWLQTLCSIEAGAVSLKSHVYEGGRVPGMLKTPLVRDNIRGMHRRYAFQIVPRACIPSKIHVS